MAMSSGMGGPLGRRLGGRAADPPAHDTVTEQAALDAPAPDPATRTCRQVWRIEARPDARERAAAAALAAVVDERQNRLDLGYAYGGGRVQIARDGDRANLASVYAMGRDGLWPDGRTFRLADNSALSLSAAQVRDMAAGAGAYYAQLVWAMGGHEAAIAALLADPANTAADIQAYDVTAGWP